MVVEFSGTEEHESRVVLQSDVLAEGCRSQILFDAG